MKEWISKPINMVISLSGGLLITSLLMFFVSSKTLALIFLVTGTGVAFFPLVALTVFLVYEKAKRLFRD